MGFQHQEQLLNIELFPCSGGMADGFRRAGVTFDLSFDADPNACNSYEANLGHRPVQMDVRDLLRMVDLGWMPDAVDLLMADPPCTPWSCAGKRKGTEDKRDMLTTTVELIERLRPRAWFIANVPGLDHADNWTKTVQPLIGGMAKRQRYCVDYASLDAADFGVPQRRVRPFWFGHREDTPCINWPQQTHCAPPVLPGCGLKPWVTCRDALMASGIPKEEWGRPVRVIPRKRGHPSTRIDEPALSITASQTGNGGGVLLLNTKHSPSNADEPSKTIRASNGGGCKDARDVSPTRRCKSPPDCH
jgi:DNA-cytosine methyltransferase